jgi:2-methylcitrate dehydratase PrpD
MVPKSMSRSFASWIHGICAEDMPDNVVEFCKGRILDSLTSIVAGQHYPWARMAVEMVRSQKGSASIVGYSYKVPAQDAAFANAVMGVIGRPDAFRRRGHPSLVIPPAALAVAEEIGAKGLDLIAKVLSLKGSQLALDNGKRAT